MFASTRVTSDCIMLVPSCCLPQDILESMRDAGISPDQHTYAALLRCCSNSLEDPKQGERTTQARISFVWKEEKIR